MQTTMTWRSPPSWMLPIIIWDTIQTVEFLKQLEAMMSANPEGQLWPVLSSVKWLSQQPSFLYTMSLHPTPKKWICLLPQGLQEPWVAGCKHLWPWHSQCGALSSQHKPAMLLCMGGITERDTNKQPHNVKNSLKVAIVETLPNITTQYVIRACYCYWSQVQSIIEFEYGFI